jgi:putative hydrolase of the HAD superfamily
VFFNVGGTVVRARRSRARILQDALAPLSIRVQREQALRAYRRLDAEYAGLVFPAERSAEATRRFWSDYDRRLLSLLGIPSSPETDAAVLSAFEDLESRPPGESYEAFPDAIPCLDRPRRAGLKVGAISNADGRLTAILRDTGLVARFDTVVNSFDERIAKPDPRIFLVATSRLGVSPGESVHVGDLYRFDVLGARAAGLRPVLLDRGDREADDDEDLDGCPVVRTLEDLPGVIGL